MSVLQVIGIACVAALVAALISGWFFSRRMHRKVSYILDALEDRETNFRFNEVSLFNRGFNRTLNRIRTLFEREKEEITEQEGFYGRMMDQVKTGIVVIDLSERREGRVIYSNVSALNMLGMATFSHVRQLGNIDKNLEQSFWNVSATNETRSSFYNERGQISIVATASETELQGKQVKIVTFNDISGEIAHNEELSWNKLIRVLTHEIMNTVTPIASLSNTLSEELLRTREDEALDREELKLGLDTIAASSKGLIKFVDTYRSLTRVSPPVKKAFYLRELIEQVRHLTQEQIHAHEASFQYTEKSDDILLYADQNQLSQVIVNLVKNALQAGATRVEVMAEIDFAESVVVTIANNGSPISKESREEIFVPFYTTKQDGSGIGLSLSRQIMRLHNGSIHLLRSDQKGTAFQLVFK